MLSCGNGNDKLVGYNGADTLEGGSGSDRFKFFLGAFNPSSELSAPDVAPPSLRMRSAIGSAMA